MAEESYKIRIDASEANAKIRELQKELMKTLKHLQKLKYGGEAFKRTQQEASALKDQIVGLQKEVTKYNQTLYKVGETAKDASAQQVRMFQGVASASRAIVGGLQVAEGTLALFGVRSEAVEKTMERLVSLMSLSQGIRSITSAMRAMTALGKSIEGTTAAARVLKAVMTPKSVLLVVAAVTALALAYEKLTAKEEDLRKAREESAKAETEQLKKSKAEYEALLKADKESRLNSEAKARYQDLKRQSAELKAQLQVLEDTDSKLRASGERWADIQANAEEYARVENESKEITRQMNALLADEASYTKEIKDNQAEIAKQRAEQLKEADDLRAALIALKAEQDESYKNSASYYLDTLALQRDQLSRMKEGTSEYVRQQIEIEKTHNALKAMYDDLPENVIGADVTASDAILKDIEVRLSQVRAMEATGEMTHAEAVSEQIMLEQMKLQEIEKGTAAYYDQVAVIANLTKQTKTASVGARAWANVAVSGLSMMSQTLASFAELQDKTTMEGFEQQKRLQISAAVMNMLGGILSAWVSAMNPANAWMTLPGQIAMGTAQTIATAALGAAQIKQIQSTQFDSSGTSVSTEALNTTMIAPTQYAQLNNGAEVSRSIGETRVYVTEGEITRTQRKVSVAESEAKY